MKNIIKYIAICLAGVSAVSCRGFLDENPKTQLSGSSVYSTKDILEAQMEGCYYTFVAGEPWLSYRQEYLEPASGLMLWGASSRSTDQWLDQLNMTKYSTTTYQNQNSWSKLYAGVNRCNRFLDNLPGSPVDESCKVELEGEAKLLRAIIYYEIVRRWGDAPLHTKSPGSLAEVNAPRTAYYKIYKQILDDLNFAQKHMRDAARQEEINFEKDRFYNYAALAFKSSVYLTIGSLLSAPADDQFWDSSKDEALIAAGKDPRTPDFKPCGIEKAGDAFKRAMECADSVITYGPYHLAKDYRKLFRWSEHEDFHLDEAICRIQISKDSGNGVQISSWYTPPCPAGTLNTVAASNAGRTRYSRFGVNNFLARTGGKMGTGKDNSTIFISSPDPRYETSVRSYYVRQDTGAEVKTYPIANITNSSSSSLPFMWKYVNPNYNGNAGQCAFYLMRLAEMYLISAEAAAQLSASKGDENWNKAISRVNELRRRAAESNDAGTLDPTVWNALEWESDDFEDRKDLALCVWWERYIELSTEGHEYFDTHRYGATWLSENISKPANAFYLTNPANTVFSAAFFKRAATEGYVYPEDPQELRKSLLLSFPQSELTTNPATTQENVNDFYWK